MFFVLPSHSSRATLSRHDTRIAHLQRCRYVYAFPSFIFRLARCFAVHVHHVTSTSPRKRPSLSPRRRRTRIILGLSCFVFVQCFCILQCARSLRSRSIVLCLRANTAISDSRPTRVHPRYRFIFNRFDINSHATHPVILVLTGMEDNHTLSI